MNGHNSEGIAVKNRTSPIVEPDSIFNYRI